MSATVSPEEALNVKFAATKFREGYDVEEVDDFLDVVVTALNSSAAGRRPELTAADVTSKQFAGTKFREGYDPQDVDDFLSRVIHTLQRAEQQSEVADLPLTPANQPVLAPLTLYDLAAQLHQTALQRPESDAMVVAIAPDGRPWHVTAVNDAEDGIILRLG